MLRVMRRGVGVIVTLLCLVWVICTVGLDQAMVGFAAVRPEAVALMVALLAINLSLISLRLWVLLRQFGWTVSGHATLRATIAGQLAGLLVIQLIGQVLGRHAVLQSYGVPPAGTAAATLYERVILFAVAAAVALPGALHLFGRAAVAELLAGLPLTEVVPAAAVGLTLSAWATAGRRERQGLTWLVRHTRAAGVSAIAGLTLAGQALVIAAFVAGLAADARGTGLLPLFGAAALVSFAAALPISVNGWGVREAAAVAVFGQIGVPAGQALAVSVTVGIVATVVILAAAPLAWLGGTGNGGRAAIGPDRPADTCDEASFTRTLVWLMTTATAMLVFFQVQVELFGSVTTVNLADPLALIGLSLFALDAVSARRPPAWRVPRLTMWLALAASAIVLGFLIGAARFGVTSWAFGNRLTGLVVLAGYLASGALAASLGGARASRQLVHALLVAAATVTIVHGGARLSAAAGWYDPALVPFNFQAYSANRNAYAFQVLATAAASACWSGVWARARRAAVMVVPLAVILVGVWMSRSRAGLVTAAALGVGSLALANPHRRAVLNAAVLAAVSVSVLALLPSLLPTDVGGAWIRPAAPQILQPTSDSERWESIVGGWRLWLAHPLFGSGLGAFMHLTHGEAGPGLVIHNTVIWLLAELGAVGTTPWLCLFLTLCRTGLQGFGRLRGRWPGALLGVLGCFALFSLAHELLYQRILWLLLGALVAVPQLHGVVRTRPTQP